jgi:hypothetical protein
MKVVLIFAFLVSVSLALECDETCNPYTLSLCKPYIPATSFCYDLNGFFTPNNIEAGVQTTVQNETNYEEFSSGFSGASSDKCKEFYVSTTCTSSFGFLVPPCDAQGNVTVPCFLSCVGGYMDCGLSEGFAEETCSAFTFLGVYASQGDNNCYVSYPFPGMEHSSMTD